MYTSILYVLDHCFYLPLNHLFLSTIVPEQLYCNEKVIFCYKQIDSTRIAGGFCVSGISIFRNTKNSNVLNRLKPIIKKPKNSVKSFWASMPFCGTDIRRCISGLIEFSVLKRYRFNCLHHSTHTLFCQ